ncbi:MAG TPA: hypothetical protein VNJ29_00050 [Candidatus Nitrosotenuis sp.]|nr:hypothetical protein [Candidatus Nitrosotenuis sp.]
MPKKSSFISNTYEKVPRDKINAVKPGIRGFYTLMKKHSMLIKGVRKVRYKIVYLGISDSKNGILSRLKKHDKSTRKTEHWNYFSIFEIRKNINQPLLRELESLILHIYRKDYKVNKLNRQRGSNLIRLSKSEFME